MHSYVNGNLPGLTTDQVLIGVTLMGNSANLESLPTVGYLKPAKFQTTYFPVSGMENSNASRRTVMTTSVDSGPQNEWIG